MSDLLLYAISTLGHTDISRFYRVFNEVIHKENVHLPEDVNVNHARLQTLRFLDALGHCDYDYEAHSISPCPPALVLLPGHGLPNAVLAGARSPELLERLKAFVRQRKQSMCYSAFVQPERYLPIPSAICIEAVNKELLLDLASSSRIAFDLHNPASWELLHFSAAIEALKNSIVLKERQDINWPRRNFSTKSLKFQRSINEETPLRLVEYTDPVTQRKRHWLWEKNQSADVDRDWGRFLLLNAHGLNILLYDERRKFLGVPKTVPLPRILARAVTLCSGFVPLEIQLGNEPLGALPGCSWLHLYSGVALPIAALISEKLGQPLIACDLVVDEEGVLL
jgi:hypothetical protein